MKTIAYPICAVPQIVFLGAVGLFVRSYFCLFQRKRCLGRRLELKAAPLEACGSEGGFFWGTTGVRENARATRISGGVLPEKSGARMIG